VIYSEPSFGSFTSKSEPRISKRFFDFLVSFVGLIVLSPLIAVVACIVRTTSAGPVLFIQTRIQRYGKTFRCMKFRTMCTGAQTAGTITTATDSRITKAGRVLRRYKLDELPQLWNVLRGEMSFVGPRPDVPGYADRLHGDDRQLLELIPGITGPATLLFRDEEELLTKVDDKMAFNDEVIYPEKVRINLEYMHTATFWRDIGYIVATVLPVLTRRLGIDQRLGLDYAAFHKQMEQKALLYKSQGVF